MTRASDCAQSDGPPLRRFRGRRKPLDALRTVRFVLKDGLVFKRDGVMTPEKFFHGGPVNGWRIW